MSDIDQKEFLQLVTRKLSISTTDAELWYREAKLPEFGGLTPAEIVQSGQIYALCLASTILAGPRQL